MSQRVSSAHPFLLALISALILACTNCSSGGASGSTGAAGGPTTLTISGASSAVLLGNTVQFTGNQTVTGWTVNGTAGGSAATGTISASGLYTAPTVLPASTAITVGATSATSSATAPLTIASDVAVTVTAGSATNPILTSSTVNLTTAISSAGHPSTAVLWTVNGVTNGSAQAGTIAPGANGTAVYTAPAVQPSASVQIVATSVADTSKSASLTRAVQGILLSAGNGVPGSIITLTGNFNTAVALTVTFSDGGTFSPSISIAPSSPRKQRSSFLSISTVLG